MVSDGDLLSQEEIDALLSQLDAAGDAGAAGDDLTDEEVEELLALGRALTGAVAGVFAQETGVTVQLGDPRLEVVLGSELPALVREGPAFTVSAGGGWQADFHVALDERAAGAGLGSLGDGKWEITAADAWLGLWQPVFLQAQSHFRDEDGREAVTFELGSVEDGAGAAAGWFPEDEVVAVLSLPWQAEQETGTLLLCGSLADMQAGAGLLAATPPADQGALDGTETTVAGAPPEREDHAPVLTSVNGNGRLELLADVPLELSVELGRTRRRLADVLALGPGSLLELDRLAGEAVDVRVNGRLVAKGEVVVIDENFGVRITDIVSPETRLRQAGA